MTNEIHTVQTHTVKLPKSNKTPHVSKCSCGWQSRFFLDEQAAKREGVEHIKYAARMENFA